MRIRTLILTSGLMLCGCVKAHRPTLVEAEPSLAFPSFFTAHEDAVGVPGRTYILDGTVLRALSLAISDFLPPQNASTPCWDRPESHRYRMIRERGAIFVRIEEDPAACGRQVPALHSGARYAISEDGRLLRRIIDGEPEPALEKPSTDGDTGEDARPGELPPLGSTEGGPPPRFLTSASDGGIPPLPPPDGGIGLP
jgi:hypothetical protein